MDNKLYLTYDVVKRGEQYERKRAYKNAQKVDKNAFCELYELYKNRLYRYAYYKLSSEEDAEDAVMDCILCAWQGIKQLKRRRLFRLDI